MNQFEQEANELIQEFSSRMKELIHKNALRTIEKTMGSLFENQEEKPLRLPNQPSKEERVIQSVSLDRATLKKQALSFIADHPNCSGTEIRAALNVKKNYRFTKGMRELCNENLVTKTGTTNKSRYTLVSQTTTPATEKNPGGPPRWKSKIVEYISAHPKKTNSQIRKGLRYKASPSTFSHHLTELFQKSEIDKRLYKGKHIYLPRS